MYFQSVYISCLAYYMHVVNTPDILVSDGMHAKLNCVYPQVTEKAMAPHSSTLAWKIPWMEEPGGLQSMGSLGVRHD